MNAQKLTKLGIIIGIISILIAAVTLFTGATGGLDSIIKEAASGKPKISCAAKIDSTFYGSPPDIMGADCVKVGVCGLTDSFSIKGLSFLTAEGKLVFDAGDVVKLQVIDVSRFSGDTIFSETLCTNSNSVLIKTLGSDGSQTDSRVVDIQ